MPTAPCEAWSRIGLGDHLQQSPLLSAAVFLLNLLVQLWSLQIWVGFLAVSEVRLQDGLLPLTSRSTWRTRGEHQCLVVACAGRESSEATDRGDAWLGQQQQSLWCLTL
jgi:hypothetical protein